MCLELKITRTHTVLQSGKQKGKRGSVVAFIVDKEAFTPVNERIYVL
jgi:hypothetical protein